MPRVRIETSEQLDRSSARALMDHVMDVIVSELRLLPDDRNISLVSYDPDLFSMKPPYRFFIEIALFHGRSREVKSRLYRAIVEKLREKHGIDPGAVMILLNEQPRENWGLRGGMRGDEIDLGYRVDI